MYVDGVTGDACGSVNLQVFTGTNSDGSAAERANTLYNSALTSLTLANRIEITGSGKPFDPTMGSGSVAAVQQRAQLDTNAPSTLMGKTCSWNEVFVAEASAL